MGNNSAAEVIAIARTMAEGELAFREGDADEAFACSAKPSNWKKTSATTNRRAGCSRFGTRWAPCCWPTAGRRSGRPSTVPILVRHPNNAWSLLGLQQALQAARKDAEAELLAPQVQQAWARADVTPVASCYCHPDAPHSATADEIVLSEGRHGQALRLPVRSQI
jgi:hypothetical protein